MLSGCDSGKSLSDLTARKTPAASVDGPANEPRETGVGTADPRAADVRATDNDESGGPETILIASFNIQVFGESKVENPRLAEYLAKIVRRFDVVAIQEIRAKAQDFLPYFVDIVNADGSRYDSVIGPRLGRTTSKEQYGFVFDTRRLEVARKGVYTVDDPHDLLHREPLVARFRVKGVPKAEAFTFTLVNIHTDPDETGPELDVLDDVFQVVQQDGAGEDDVILLGDLNVDERRFGQLGRVPGIAWAIRGLKTNTRQNQQYDNILFDSRATTEFTGLAGVFDLRRELRLTTQQALEISDHLPVWAEFRSREDRASRLVSEPTPARTR